MEQLRIHSEILMIVSLAMLINSIQQRTLHMVTIAVGGITVSTLDLDNSVQAQECVYEWNPGYLPKLRKLRNDLEQQRDAMLKQLREVSA